MGRLKELRALVNQELMRVQDSESRISATAHLYGVSLAATLIAEKRSQPSELASMAAMLHDLHAYISGSYEDHAARGATLARSILERLGSVNREEMEVIVEAIARHDDKDVVDGPLDEVLKDADVMHHVLNDLSKQVKAKEAARYAALRREFGLDA